MRFVDPFPEDLLEHATKVRVQMGSFLAKEENHLAAQAPAKPSQLEHDVCPGLPNTRFRRPMVQSCWGFYVIVRRKKDDSEAALFSQPLEVLDNGAAEVWLVFEYNRDELESFAEQPLQPC